MLHAGISSYQNSSLALKSSRQQEVEMLNRINAEFARALNQPDNVIDYNNALLRNQRVWNIFLVALTDENHPYPTALKAELISLGIWVNRQTQKAISDRDEVQSLISLNQSIIAGLSPKPTDQEASAEPDNDNSFSSAPQYQGDMT